jgi:hypothetical protein
MRTVRSIPGPVDLSGGSADALRHALALRRGARAIARGRQRRLLGGTAERALRLAPCPVLTVRPSEG